MNLFFAVVLAASAWANEILLEAEDAEHFGVSVESADSGFSGAGYVTGFDAPGDSLRFTFDVEPGVYELRLGVRVRGRLQTYQAWIDGDRIAGTLFGTGAGFAERRLGERLLEAGTHRLVFASAAGGVDVDYLRLVPLGFEPPVKPPVQLSDPQASAAARALFGFLVDRYGEQILSGQQELREVEYVARVTGREPAIAGGDLIEYSPSRWERGARPGRNGYASVEDLIAWAQRDGIVSLMWHWNAPTDLLDTPAQPWYRGFYTEATTFNFAEALADPSSERYQLMLRDIDAIAVQLRKLADADVPVLWRPLHEAAGTWFWWGAHGPEPYKQLWRLLYDRLVNHHGLHHLVWVYTHEPGAAEWYPGDAYVDVVGRDVYSDDERDLMRGQWDELQGLYGDRKLVTLSESGTLPPADVSTAYGVWWSWFTIWNDWPGSPPDFIRAVDVDYLTEVYHSERVVTRDELPDWRSNTTSAEPVHPARATGLALYPNPTSGRAIVRATLPTAADVGLAVFDVTGRQVAARAIGYQPAGEHAWTLDLDGAAPGVYVVRVDAGGSVAHRMLVVVR